jgi:hypothetical protein
MPFTFEEIEALAPDQASIDAARRLLKPSGWPRLAWDGFELVWGECQGSGATPYRVVVSESDAGYKCSCPSRKFPCKHSLALMWIRAEGKVGFPAAEVPEWVRDWVSRRRGPTAGDAASHGRKTKGFDGHLRGREPLTGETIPEVGAEGGTISLFGDKDAQGRWRFWARKDETMMSDVLDEDEPGGLGSLVNTSEPVSSLPEALALLDKYSWHRLKPLRIHSEFGLAILSEVQKRGTSEEGDLWNSHDRLTRVEGLAETTDPTRQDSTLP